MTGWIWEYEGYDPADGRLRESLCTLGNGYFVTRGALPECAERGEVPSAEKTSPAGRPGTAGRGLELDVAPTASSLPLSGTSGPELACSPLMIGSALVV
ncbi:putative glycosyl hydrolase [Streptomyces afghaniensis 772]|uniref:Putative glycosyl hydrolase n=1 Tax=Streptomyces afghaniensis 772 TaxID=1283301 RepID=S4MXA6_9ACTN|nr:putative glycosyl hydrolase [Streptomyces afghaniensis 772]